MTRCLFPCFDFIDDYYRVSTVRIVTDQLQAEIFCLGKTVRQEIIGKRLIQEFEVNKIININYLPLAVGRFELVRLPIKDRKVINFYCQSKNLAYRVQTNEIDHITFFNKLLEFEDDVLRLDNSICQEFNWLFLDNFSNYSIKETISNKFVYRLDSLFFYRTVMLDSSIVLDNKSMDTFIFNQSEIILRFTLSLHLEKLAIKSLHDYWIFSGASQFIADSFAIAYQNDLFTQHIFESKKREFYRMVQEGKDINPLNCPNFMHPSEASFDICYNLKCCLVFHMIKALCKSTVGDFASLFLTDDYVENGKTHVTYTDTKKAYKKIKQTFGIKDLKLNLQQFLINTGCSELDCAYTHDRKGNRLKLMIRQTPLHLPYFRKVMNERFALEKFCNVTSPLKKLFDTFQTSLINLGNSSEGFISSDSVNAFLSDDGRILINSYYNSLKYLSGVFVVIVTVTNDIELNKEIHEIKLEDRQDQEISFQMRNKFRRVVQKKGAEIDTIGGIGNDQDTNFSIMGGSHTKYSGGYDSKNDNLLVGGAPYLWIRLDPSNHYLRKVIVREGENIYLAQLENEMKEPLDQQDLVSIYRILESLVTCATSATVNKIYSYINAKDVDQLIKIEMINTLTNLDSKLAPNRVSDVLLGQIKRLKYESDFSLKPNDFNGDYFLLNHLIERITKYERKFKKSQSEPRPSDPSQPKEPISSLKPNPQTDESIIDLLLTLLQKNDNSQNNFDDTFYQANILRSLFRCLNVANFNQILVEVNRFLKIEYFTHYDYKYLIDAIFSEFVGFISTHYDHLGISLAGSSHEFYDNPNLRRFPLLLDCLKPFHELSEKHKYDPVLCRAVFRLNFSIKRRINKLKPWEILIWGLKYIEEARRTACHFTTNKIFETFLFNLEKHRSEFKSIQKSLSMQNNKLVCRLLFETVTCPYAYIDVQYRFYALSLYRLIYDEFIPVCNLENYESFTFPLDMAWLSFRFELNFEKSVSNEEKIFTLHHLSMQNRRRTISGQTAPFQGSSQYNLRELIFQNFKFTKESPTWRNLGKQIINVLSSEKSTMQIESSLAEGSELEQTPGQELAFRGRQPSASLRELKKKMMKPSQAINSMEEFKDELFKVVEFYLQNQYIQKEVYAEYIEFSRALILEAEKILKEKAQKEEELLRKMKLKHRPLGER